MKSVDTAIALQKYTTVKRLSQTSAVGSSAAVLTQLLPRNTRMLCKNITFATFGCVNSMVSLTHHVHQNSSTARG
jgi:hypothetical protein